MKQRIHRVPKDPSGHVLTPPEALMLSRLDDDLSVEELLDVASLPRTQALRAVVRLLDEGLVLVRGRP
jgi:hypothetical protein